MTTAAQELRRRLLKHVGFIGLGNMGSRMAANLINSGFEVSVHDINSAAVKTFLDKGVPVKETPRQIAEASDAVITMLPSSGHDMAESLLRIAPGRAINTNKVKASSSWFGILVVTASLSKRLVYDVYTGKNGLLQSGSPVRPWLFIDSSTIDPQTSRKLSSAVSACALKENIDHWQNSVMLDAPVSGGILAAEAGTLTFMVGGSEEAYLAAEPLFLSMGKASIYCGGAGNGSAAKICNNLAMAVSMIGVSEALALGQSLGIPSRILTKIFNSSSARCWSSDSYNPVPGVMEGAPSSRNYYGGFASKLMAKDLNLAVASAKGAGARHPMTSHAYEIYDKLCKEGHDAEDFSCIFRHYYGGRDEV